MASASLLDGLRVLLTRPAAQAGEWAAALTDAGANVLAYPTIDIAPPPSWEPLDEALGRVREYDWLVFTSAAAVRHTLGRLKDALPSLPRIAAVGAETARAVETHGLRVTLVPEDQRQEGLISALNDLRPGTRVLFPQAVGGRDELRNALLGRGCVVDVVFASQTVPRREQPPLPAFDVATFASPSALRAFVAAHGPAPLVAATVAVIGPTTAAAAEAFGLHPIVAKAPNVDALIHAIATAR